MTDDEQAIRDLVSTWLEASKAGDLKTLLGLLTDDVVFMTCGQEPFGKDGFTERSRGLDLLQLEAKSDILEVVVAGDIAYIRTHLEIGMTPPGGDPVRRAGYTLTVMRKDHGTWRLARDANLLTSA